ncbi:MAG: AAA family ATPase, partial [SAR324 cluster bacterium]|nr:AAA family ATPase [SAR324 cluster bacterium]
HELRYTVSSLKTAAELSAKYINDRYLPDKAIDVIDETGAAIRLKGAGRKTVNSQDIEKVIASIARIPLERMNSSDKEKLKDLEKELQLQVFGQDNAIHALVQAIKRSRAGLRQSDQPIGSFLFTGPTGVGKTELAKQLAQITGIHFQRFDMSEYMEKHTVSRLIGAPPGYVGYDQGGLLTDAIRKHPHTVLLLDEIEKAHPDIFNILLQVMDHATLTDNNGREADFRNVVLIMTCNVGAKEMASSVIGFGSQSPTTPPKQALERTFSPEFRNRLDAIISFAQLPKEVVQLIVDKLIIQLEIKLQQKKVTINVTNKARDWLANKGYDPHFGARPMKRVIQQEIETVLADEVLFGNLENGGEVTIGLKANKLTFKYN